MKTITLPCHGQEDYVPDILSVRMNDGWTVAWGSYCHQCGHGWLFQYSGMKLGCNTEFNSVYDASDAYEALNIPEYTISTDTGTFFYKASQ